MHVLIDLGCVYTGLMNSEAVDMYTTEATIPAIFQSAVSLNALMHNMDTDIGTRVEEAFLGSPLRLPVKIICKGVWSCVIK